MVQWQKLLFADGQRGRSRFHDEVDSLLPTRSREDISSAIPSKEVTRIAIRLKHLVEAVIPSPLEEEQVTKAHSPVITPGVVDTAKSAGGKQRQGCVVYCLLVCKKWFIKQAQIELWDADLHHVRAIACEIIAKHIIEGEEDQRYLLEEVLLKRYSIFVNEEDTPPTNAIERAVDLHALRVIGSFGYQKCISYLWRGWLIQDEDDPSRFIEYKHKTSTSYWTHFDPDRMRVPKYQNAVQVTFSIVFLAFYTGAINTINPTGDLDPIEGLLYVFTLGFAFDEIAKFWKVGRFYLAFWNMFNSTLYALLAISFTLRMIALGHPVGDDRRAHLNQLSYNFLAFSAPMFWMRLLLYLDSYRFFGATLVIIRVMMKESLIFFALLIVVLIGFLQAFYGMDLADQQVDEVAFIMRSMANVIMGSPDFSGFDHYAPPFGIILYYIFSFLVMVILLNILIALYNSAYSDITEHALDEYMALFAAKTLQFVRAPDENVYIPPFNLIEVFILVIPFEWWLPEKTYERLNDYIMGIIYCPVLFITAGLEARVAIQVRKNRRRGDQDDDTLEEWEQLPDDNVLRHEPDSARAEEEHSAAEEWSEQIAGVAAKVIASQSQNQTLKEVEELRKEVGELRALMESMHSRRGAETNEGTRESRSDG